MRIDPFRMKTFNADPRELYRLQNESFNGVFLTMTEGIAYYNALHKHDMPILETKDRIFFLAFSVYFPKNSCLRKAFSDQLNKYNTNGLIDYWTSKFTKEKTKYSDHLNEVNALKFNQIQGILVLTVMLYGFAFVIFVAELLSVRFVRIRKSIDFLTFQGRRKKLRSKRIGM